MLHNQELRHVEQLHQILYLVHKRYRIIYSVVYHISNIGIKALLIILVTMRNATTLFLAILSSFYILKLPFDLWVLCGFTHGTHISNGDFKK
jgi:hypothetical protein